MKTFTVGNLLYMDEILCAVWLRLNVGLGRNRAERGSR